MSNLNHSAQQLKRKISMKSTAAMVHEASRTTIRKVDESESESEHKDDPKPPSKHHARGEDSPGERSSSEEFYDVASHLSKSNTNSYVSVQSPPLHVPRSRYARRLSTNTAADRGKFPFALHDRTNEDTSAGKHSGHTSASSNSFKADTPADLDRTGSIKPEVPARAESRAIPDRGFPQRGQPAPPLITLTEATPETPESTLDYHVPTISSLRCGPPRSTGAAYRHHASNAMSAYPHTVNDDTVFLHPRTAPQTPPRGVHQNRCDQTQTPSPEKSPSGSSVLVDLETASGDAPSAHLSTPTKKRISSLSARLLRRQKKHSDLMVHSSPLYAVECRSSVHTNGREDDSALETTPSPSRSRSASRAAPDVPRETSAERLRRITWEGRSLPAQFFLMLWELLRKFGKTVADGFSASNANRMTPTTVDNEYYAARESMRDRMRR